MSRAIVILVISFVIGAGCALIVRAGLHHPYAVTDAPMSSPPAMDAHAPVHLPAEPSTPASALAPVTAPKPSASAPPAPVGALDLSGILALKPGKDTVNTICPVCGFEVDPTLPTSTYHGLVVGFGCRPNRCKEKFDAEPERYGPAALANRKAE